MGATHSTICGFSDDFEANKRVHPQEESTLHNSQTPSQCTTIHVEIQSLSSHRDFTLDQKLGKIMIKHWQTIIDQKPDIFHKTMLMSIEASPKLNEIIACGYYCYKDLTKWPKLNRICDGQLKFFKEILMDKNLDPKFIKEQADILGEKHKVYANYGLKPQFLDLFHQHFTRQLEKLKIQDSDEKAKLIQGCYMIERTYFAYSISERTPNSNVSETSENA
uniref:Globin family profile domain-containing protein n=1 Tax=Panagrolaimus sp. JU765 TaxID=591449 RepID=A0AC34RIC3_9BILA